MWDAEFKIVDYKLDSLNIFLSSGDDYIGILHSRLREFVIARLYEPVVLGENVLDHTASLCHVSFDTARQAKVVVSEHENGQIHQISESLFVEGEDTLEDEDGLSLQLSVFILVPFVRNEIVNGYFYVLVLEQLEDLLVGQVEV